MTAHDLSSRLLVICDRIAAGGKFDADEESHLLIEAARLLAAQPTDAQKIEALKLASIAGFTLSGQFPPEALRLLGLPTGDETSSEEPRGTLVLNTETGVIERVMTPVIWADHE